MFLKKKSKKQYNKHINEELGKYMIDKSDNMENLRKCTDI